MSELDAIRGSFAAAVEPHWLRFVVCPCCGLSGKVAWLSKEGQFVGSEFRWVRKLRCYRTMLDRVDDSSFECGFEWVEPI